jgi:hypothetical protein
LLPWHAQIEASPNAASTKLFAFMAPS